MNWKSLCEEYYQTLRELAFDPISNGKLSQAEKEKISNLFRRFERVQKEKNSFIEELFVNMKKYAKIHENLLNLPKNIRSIELENYEEQKNVIDGIINKIVMSNIDTNFIKMVARDHLENLIETKLASIVKDRFEKIMNEELGNKEIIDCITSVIDSDLFINSLKHNNPDLQKLYDKRPPSFRPETDKKKTKRGRKSSKTNGNEQKSEDL